MSTDLTPAIFGLVGVVVGAIVTGGVQVFLDWLHERRAVKRAKRLVSGELLQLITVLRSAYDTGRWPQWADISLAFDTSAWRDERPYLAAAVSLFSWTRLVGCYTQIPVISATFTAAVAAGKIQIDAATIASLTVTAKNMNDARKDLGGIGIPFPEFA
jgi:hypothetical protein